MSDGMVLLLIALAVAAVPVVLQMVLCLKCDSMVGKLWPMVLFLPVWVPCLLDMADVIGLPRTYFLFGTVFHDVGTIAVLGFPILAGLLIGWGFAWALRRLRK